MATDEQTIEAQEAFAALKSGFERIDDGALDILFNGARTVNGWTDRPVTDEQIIEIFDLLKMAPTSANVSPARFVVLRSTEAKERLRPALSGGNTDKTISAPATFIIAYDLDFAERMDFLFPHDPSAPSWFSGDDVKFETAFRNGTLQGAYLMMAARAIGLDCGPMSGFDNAAVDEEFFAGTQIKSNFLCNVGYGDPKSIFGRSPRFNFDDVCQIL